MKVLVVDDNQKNRLLLIKIFESNGYEVSEASNGIEALESIEESKPDLIVSDILMPKMDGFTFLHKLKQYDEFKDIPFVYYTAHYVDKKDKEFAESLGASKFIIKPKEAMDFINEIKNVMAEHATCHLTTTKLLLETEGEYLKQYSNRVVQKLEEKYKDFENSEEKYRILFESSSDAIMLLDKTGFFDCNSTTLRIFGYDNKDDFIILHPSDISPPFQPDGMDSLTASNLRIEEAFTNNHANFEWMHKRKSGTKFFAEVTLTAFQYGERKVLQATVRDITERKAAENKLKKTTELLQSVMDNATDEAIITTDEMGTILIWNEGARRLLGYEPEEVVGKKNIRIFETEEYTKSGTMDVNIKKMMGTGKPLTLELEYITKNGKIIPVQTIVSPRFDEDGKFIGTVGMARDITERKRSEKALQESEERFQQVVENAHEWIWETDANGLYTYSSPILEKILGYKPEEIVGKKHFYDLIHPENREEVKKAAFEIFAQKQPFREFINRNVRKDGEMIWYSTSGVPILDEEGNLLGYRGVDMDITERKQAEEKLKQVANEWSITFDSITDPISILDRDFKLVRVNKAYAKAMNANPDDLIGKFCFDVIHGTDKCISNCPHIQSLETKQSATIELFNSRFGKYVEVSTSPIFDEDDKVIGSVYTIKNITERKVAEEEKRNYLVERTRTQLQSFVVSALPVFASGTTPQTRNMLASKFAQNFEDNVMPEFKQEMDDLNKSVQGTKITTQTDNLSQYLSWLQHFFANLGAQPNIASDGFSGNLEFSNCYWSNSSDINPVFCLICRAMVLRSFTWTNLKGSVNHSNSIANGSSTCRFDIVLNKGEM